MSLEGKVMCHSGACDELACLGQKMRQVSMAADLPAAVGRGSGRVLCNDAVLFSEEGADSRVEEVVAQDDRHDVQVRVNGQGR